ncbi:MAG: hypothetical protein IH984_06980 [Planctomycetes bacterium]|nr:hypothetical protein [Planctomycetota bacterium]
MLTKESKRKVCEDIQMKVDFYADAFEKTHVRVGNGELASMIVPQIGKDLRTAQIQNANGNSCKSNGDVAATPKQLAYLKRLGVSFEEGLSKKQASELIDEAVTTG